MSNATQSQTTLTQRGVLERLFFSIVTTVPCVVFLYINGTLLFTLRSKPVFCETSRYILLYNLLFADIILLVDSQLLFIIATFRMRMTYIVCGVVAMIANLTNDISPLTLVVMSLERYVAVCYPLRHTTFITIKNTGVAIIVVWTISSLSVLTRVLLLLNFPFEELETLQMKNFCGKESMLLDPMSDLYDRGSTYFLCVLGVVTVIYSYVGVVVAARSASTDKASARKAQNTLLLHLVQLGLSLSSTIHNPMLIAFSKVVDRITLVRIQVVLYVCVIIFPRCLSALIYGIRDQTIRPVLMHNLCCQRKRSPSLSEASTKAKVKLTWIKAKKKIF